MLSSQLENLFKVVLENGSTAELEKVSHWGVGGGIYSLSVSLPLSFPPSLPLSHPYLFLVPWDIDCMSCLPCHDELKLSSLAVCFGDFGHTNAKSN